MGSKQTGGRHQRQSRSSTTAVLPEEGGECVGRNIGEQTKPVQWLAFRGEAFVAARQQARAQQTVEGEPVHTHPQPWESPCAHDHPVVRERRSESSVHASGPIAAQT
jgi:hypothetical protein